MKPKGKILIIGGAEDKGDPNDNQKENKKYKGFEILNELLPENGKKGRIEIITTASGVPDEIKDMYSTAFKKIGYEDTGFLYIADKTEARDPKLCEQVSKAHAVFFSGGDQFKLVATLGGTDTIDVIKHKYRSDENFIIAGTSAGAMAIPQLMVYEGGRHEAMLKDDLKISSGFGILENCIVDTHFIKRGRFGRLAHAITMNPECLGIGLGEDTALIIENGDFARCCGSGMVVIIDGNQIQRTNIVDIANSDPIFVENLIVHILAKGNIFSIKSRKMKFENAKKQ